MSQFQVKDNIQYNLVDSSEPKVTNSGLNSLPPQIREKVKEFLSTNNPCLYILTPCFASLCYVNYVHCLMRTKDFFLQIGIELHIEFCKNDSLVCRARNNLIARSMNNPKSTHFIFIDNDISWDPIDILKLLISGKKLVGGVYPLKHYDWKDLIVDKKNPENRAVIPSWLDSKNKSQFKDMIPDPLFIQQKLLRYNINFENNTLEIKDNLARVKHLATGFMMIQRDVIEKMFMAFPDTKYTDDIGFLRDTENNFAYALFDCGVEDDHYLSEDWMFCHRWKKMGGNIWIDVSINLTHTGIEDYNGSFIASII